MTQNFHIRYGSVPIMVVAASVNDFQWFFVLPYTKWVVVARILPAMGLYRLVGFSPFGIIVGSQRLPSVETKLRRETEIWGNTFASRAVKLMWAG